MKSFSSRHNSISYAGITSRIPIYVNVASRKRIRGFPTTFGQHALTLSYPASPPRAAAKVAERYTRSCLNLNPSLRASGRSNSSRSGARRSASGTARRSTTNTSQLSRSPSPPPPPRQATWRSVTVGNCGGVVAGEAPQPVPAAAGLPRRRGFHSASRATTRAAARERRRRASFGEDPPPVTRCTTNWVGGGGAGAGSVGAQEKGGAEHDARRLHYV